MKTISLCTVSIESLKPYLDLMIKSALDKLTNLHEIIICTVDAGTAPERKFKVGNVNIRRISSPYSKDFSHALGLHECIDNSEADYIMFCDPDIIFHTDVDDLYFNLMEKYNINYIGCAHEHFNKQPYGGFPCVVNSLVKKTDLPNVNFLETYLYYNSDLRPNPINYEKLKKATGKYLIPGAIPELVDKFEKVDDPFFDTGCNLYLWSKQQNWRWLSFLAPDIQNYKTTFYRTNFKLKDSIKLKKILYHQCGTRRTEGFEKFQQVYQKLKEEDNEGN